VDQIAALSGPARTAGRRPGEPVSGPAETRRRPARGAAVADGAGEGRVLLTLDLLAVAAVTLAAGASWPATAAWASLTALAMAVAGLYRPRLQFSLLDDLPRLVFAVALVQAGGAWVTQTSILSAIVTAAVVAGGRVIGYRLLRWRRRRSPGRAALIVGCGAIAARLGDALCDDRGYGITPVGFVGPRGLTPLRLPVLASTEGLEKAVAKYKPLHLIVAFPATSDADLVSALRRCRRYGVTVHVVPRLFELAAGRTGIELVRGIPLVRLRPDPAQMRRWALKRLIDITGAVVGLIVLAPVLAVCALAVLAESGRHGVLFRQERISRGGLPFTILKFRSLTPSSDRESQVKWNINTDSRLGRVGRLLRVSSLDELPQLLNVLRGDMSLVGPRPERPYFVEEFERTYAGYPDRHRVPAGITGWAQIHGLRGDTSIEERVRFDNHYIEHWSLGLDVKIILRTVGSMLAPHRG
jgi:exopolysaccharide biosynthesis polyprenyl glycosylphosphotransferase